MFSFISMAMALEFISRTLHWHYDLAALATCISLLVDFGEYFKVPS